MHEFFQNKWIVFVFFLLLICLCMCLAIKVCLCPKTVVVQTIKTEELPA